MQGALGCHTCHSFLQAHHLPEVVRETVPQARADGGVGHRAAHALDCKTHPPHTQSRLLSQCRPVPLRADLVSEINFLVKQNGPEALGGRCPCNDDRGQSKGTHFLWFGAQREHWYDVY